MGRRYYSTATETDLLASGPSFNLELGLQPSASGSQTVTVSGASQTNYFFTPPLHPGPISFREYATNRGWDIAAGFTGGAVRAIATTSDGKMYVGGSFVTFQGEQSKGIVRLNADGTKDISFDNSVGFNSSAGASVTCLATTSDGKVYVGGAFTTYKGVTENRIVRLNNDGSIDTTFDNGTGFNDTINALAITADGKVYVGGAFTTYKGVTETRIIRLNSDGTKDTAFNCGGGFNGIVYSLVPTSDGKLYVGGAFTQYNSVTNNYIIRLNSDGTKDGAFDNTTGFNGNALSMSLTSSGTLYVGGDFTTYKGVANVRIIRLNSNGTKDDTFDGGTGFNGVVWSVAATSAGTVYVGGWFTTYRGVTNNYFIRLLGTGAEDSNFENGTAFNSFVYATLPTSAGDVYVGGAFTTYQGNTCYGLVLLNSTGGRPTVGGTVVRTAQYAPLFNKFRDFNDIVRSILLTPEGKVYVGGIFTTYRGVSSPRIIRLNADGTIDTTFNCGAGFNDLVYAIALTPEGKVYVAGSFTTYNTTTSCKGIVRLNSDGSVDTAFSVGAGFGAGYISVEALALTSDGKVYASGSFSTYQSATNNYIIRLNADGTKDTAFDNSTGFNSSVSDIKLDANGKLYAVGAFTTYKGVAANRIIRLNSDGTKDTGFDNTTGFDSRVLECAFANDGKVYVGGTFTTYKGQTENGIIRLNVNGSKDTAFDNSTGFNGQVYELAVDANGDLYCGGLFTTYKGATNNNIIRLNSDGTKDTAFDNSTGFSANNFVSAIKFGSGGRVYVGGSFTTYKGVSTPYFAVLQTDGKMVPDRPRLVLNITGGSGVTLTATLEKIDVTNTSLYLSDTSNSIVLPSQDVSSATFTTAGTSSSTVPADAVTATVRAWGGGGGGGGRSNVGNGGAGGGGGGAYSQATFAVTPGQTISVTVGAAGTAGPTSDSAGGNGGASTATYASVVRVNAGGGGGGGGGVSGSAGAAGTVAVGTGFSGGAGAAGSTTVGGGGGGGAGTTGAGGSASGATAGTGTSLSGGNGGSGGSGNAAGSAGSVAGGGGGGGSRNSGGAKGGGAGAVGRVEILYQRAAPSYTEPQVFYFTGDASGVGRSSTSDLDLGEFMRSHRLRVALQATNGSSGSVSFTFNHNGTYLDFPAPTIQRRSS